MIPTVSIESREVASASDAPTNWAIPGRVIEMRSALKDITMTENKMVVAVKRTSERSENMECTMCNLTKCDQTSS
jgi:hypothetical protein